MPGDKHQQLSHGMLISRTSRGNAEWTDSQLQDWTTS